MSTRATAMPRLFAGRVAGGVGTSLLFSAPEAWLVGEHARRGLPGSTLGATFGWAFFGDSIVAISAGLLAQTVASRFGPSAPFLLSVPFLAAGAALVALTWRENTAAGGGGGGGRGAKPKASERAIGEAWDVVRNDKRMLLLGAMQSLFEGAMYIFVLQWPPALIGAIRGGAVPFGKVFSCLMACCMIGSSLFSALSRRLAVETSAVAMFGAATAAMALATVAPTSLPALIAAFFVFEVCVGLYFPSIGTLRSKYATGAPTPERARIFSAVLRPDLSPPPSRPLAACTPGTSPTRTAASCSTSSRSRSTSS